MPLYKGTKVKQSARLLSDPEPWLRKRRLEGDQIL